MHRHWWRKRRWKWEVVRRRDSLRLGLAINQQYATVSRGQIAMLHTEAIPGWFLPLSAAGIVLLALLWFWAALRRHFKRKRRRERKRQSAAYAWTWDWLMRFRHRGVPRLTDQRARRD